MRPFNNTELKKLFNIDYATLCNNITILESSTNDGTTDIGCRPTWDSVTRCSSKDTNYSTPGYCCDINFNGGNTNKNLPMKQNFHCGLEIQGAGIYVYDQSTLPSSSGITVNIVTPKTTTNAILLASLVSIAFFM